MTNAATPAHTDARPALSAESSDEWLELVDQALLGLDHALNNRLGALRAFAELLRDEHWRTTSAATDSVQKELARLEETTSVVRLLARPRQVAETGLILEEVMTDVVRLQSMLYDLRDVPIDFVPGPPLEPVWSDRSALIRLLSLLFYSLRRRTRATAEDRGGALRVSTESDDQWVRIGLRTTAPASEWGAGRAMSDYTASLASSIGAAWRVDGELLEIRLPTLKAHRAASQRARDAR